jgi:uncharacterized membrane protein
MNTMKDNKKNWMAYGIGFLFTFLVRLLPFRAPNVEPILATQMPLSISYGAVSGFFFGFVSIVLFDSITSGLGAWTLVTALAYGSLGVFASLYFKNKGAKNSPKDYAIFAAFATIFYDTITGLTVGPILFHQSFTNALVGQIPFTALHLIGNVTFAYFLSPYIYHLTIKYKNPQFSFIKKLLVKTS